MRNWVLWSVTGFVFWSLNGRAETPYGNINAQVCAVPCEGIDDPRERGASESDKSPTHLPIRISTVTLKSEGGWFSAGDASLYLEEQGENRYQALSLLPLVPDQEGNFLMQDRAFTGEASTNVGDGQYEAGRILGKISKYNTPGAQLVSLDGSLRFPFPHRPANVISFINRRTKTLAVADSVNKVFTLSENGKAPYVSMPFPQQAWNALHVTSLGDRNWLIILTDAPLVGTPSVPEFGKLPPPRPVYRYHAYLATDRALLQRPIKSWEGSQIGISVAATLSAAAIRVIQTRPSENGRLLDQASTESIYWVGSDASLKEISASQVNHWDTREIYSTNEYIVYLFQDPESGTTTVVWWNEPGKMKKSTFPTPKAGLFARHGVRNWRVLSDGSILFDCLPNPKANGPAAFTNDDPPQKIVDPRSLPRHMFVLLPEKAPIGIRFDIANPKPGEIDLLNPWNYSIYPTENHIWLMSRGLQKGEMYIGQIPVEKIRSAK